MKICIVIGVVLFLCVLVCVDIVVDDSNEVDIFFNLVDDVGGKVDMGTELFEWIMLFKLMKTCYFEIRYFKVVMVLGENQLGLLIVLVVDSVSVGLDVLI